MLITSSQLAGAGKAAGTERGEQGTGRPGDEEENREQAWAMHES
jgi:hypothetical protein